MKTFHVVLFGLLSFVIISCSIKEGEIEKCKFDKIEKIKGMKEFAPFRFYKQPSIHILKNYLIIYAPLSTEKKIDVYDINTFKYITSTGISGKGPGEITAAGPICTDNVNKCIWVCDFGKLLMYKFDMDSMLAKNDYKPSSSYKMPSVGFINFSFLTSDSLIANTMDMEEKQVKIRKICLKNQTMVNSGYKVPDQIKTSNYYSAFFSFNYRQKSNDMICAFQFSDLLLFMNKNGKVLKGIEGPDGIKKLMNPDSHNGAILNYSQVISSDHYVFTLYNGAKHGPANIMGSGNFIRIFTHKGEYIKTIALEENLADICFDADNKRIIAISNDRENALIYFDVNL